MKLTLRSVQIFAFVCSVAAWTLGASMEHQMPIKRTSAGYVDKTGSPCSESDFRRGVPAVRVFVGGGVVMALSTLGLALREEADPGRLTRRSMRS